MLSSFLLNGGRIGHLAHEYSGKHLKNAIHNTHKPKGARTELSIKLCDDSGITMEIKELPQSASVNSFRIGTYKK
jgi:hypothetical protein